MLTSPELPAKVLQQLRANRSTLESEAIAAGDSAQSSRRETLQIYDVAIDALADEPILARLYPDQGLDTASLSPKLKVDIRGSSDLPTGAALMKTWDIDTISVITTLVGVFTTVQFAPQRYG